MTCQCGHDADTHYNGNGRCDEQCIDLVYGTYRCLCPYYTEER